MIYLIDTVYITVYTEHIQMEDEDMKLKVLTGQSIPIYEQLYNQIKLHILRGEIKSQDQLPSIRGLAREVKVSIITVKKAYEDLEQDGFIYSIPSKGYYVKEQDTNAVRLYYEKKIIQAMGDIKEAAKTIGLDEDTLFEFLRKHY